MKSGIVRTSLMPNPFVAVHVRRGRMPGLFSFVHGRRCGALRLSRRSSYGRGAVGRGSAGCEVFFAFFTLSEAGGDKNRACKKSESCFQHTKILCQKRRPDHAES